MYIQFHLELRIQSGSRAMRGETLPLSSRFTENGFLQGNREAPDREGLANIYSFRWDIQMRTRADPLRTFKVRRATAVYCLPVARERTFGSPLARERRRDLKHAL
jgi:hypothetical protein